MVCRRKREAGLSSFGASGRGVSLHHHARPALYYGGARRLGVRALRRRYSRHQLS